MFEPERSSKRELAANATQGGFALAGGVGLLVVHALGTIPILGFIAGAALAYFGYTMMSGKNKKPFDGIIGAGLTAIGILAAATQIPILGGISSFVLISSGVVLIAYGILKLVRFFKGR